MLQGSPRRKEARNRIVTLFRILLVAAFARDFVAAGGHVLWFSRPPHPYYYLRRAPACRRLLLDSGERPPQPPHCRHVSKIA